MIAHDRAIKDNHRSSTAPALVLFNASSTPNQSGTRPNIHRRRYTFSKSLNGIEIETSRVLASSGAPGRLVRVAHDGDECCAGHTIGALGGRDPTPEAGPGSSRWRINQFARCQQSKQSGPSTTRQLFSCFSREIFRSVDGQHRTEHPLSQRAGANVHSGSV